MSSSADGVVVRIMWIAIGAFVLAALYDACHGGLHVAMDGKFHTVEIWVPKPKP